VAKLATLINIQLAVSSLRGSTITAERVLEAPPPPAYQEIPKELDPDTVEIQSPEVINATKSLGAISDLPSASGGKAPSIPKKKIIDHYLPEELSSLTLEDDHGVSN
jgi:hypothetical protein